MARRKQETLIIPATELQAVRLVEEYVAADRTIMQRKLVAEALIDGIKAERDAQIAVIEADQKGRFAAIKGWWEAGGHKVAKDRRSAELAGAKIGIRLSPPKVKFARGVNADKIVAWLAALPKRAGYVLLRAKVELDKPTVIKAIQAKDVIATALAERGVSVAQDDEFFIDSGLDEESLRKDMAASG